MQRHAGHRIVQRRSGGGFTQFAGGTLSPEDLRKLLVPVEDIDAVAFVIRQQREFGLPVEIRTDERVAALDIVAQVGQRAFLKHAEHRLKALLRFPFQHFEQE